MNQTIILRIPAIKSCTGYSRSTIYNRIADGTLPKPVKLGPRLVGIPQHEIEAIISARVAGKTDEEIRQLVSSLETNRRGNQS